MECCVALNFVCIDKNIYWFSFIYTMVNCSVWLECRTCDCDIHTLPSGLTYSSVGYRNVWSAQSVVSHGWVEWDYGQL